MNKCPNCSESNKPDSKFCAKCRMVLMYDAYTETLDLERKKEDKLTAMEERFNNMQMMIEKLITATSQVENRQQFSAIAQSLFISGMIKTEEKISRD